MKRVIGLMRRFWIVLAGVGVVLVAGLIYLYMMFYGGNDFEEERLFLVWKGQSFSSIVDSLETKEIIRDRRLFVFVAKILGGTEHIKVGRYRLQSGISNDELFTRIRDGAGNEPVVVSVPEGVLSRRQASIFAKRIGIDSAAYVQLVNDQEFISSLGLETASLEGYLLPETYSFNWQTDERSVIRAMVGQFKAFYDDSLKTQADAMGWTTNQVLSLAAIVEGEAILDEERPRIAGVYHNRLNKRMRLEADPTVQYIISDGPRRLLYEDLRIQHPYNTYRNYGLPPGPVNNPGKASIVATLYPEKNNYLFFVANTNGGHWFATSYSEHLSNVRKFRRERRKRESSALTHIQSGGQK